jgi:hypothetical protein
MEATTQQKNIKKSGKVSKEKRNKRNKKNKSSVGDVPSSTSTKDTVDVTSIEILNKTVNKLNDETVRDLQLVKLSRKNSKLKDKYKKYKSLFKTALIDNDVIREELDIVTRNADAALESRNDAISELDARDSITQDYLKEKDDIIEGLKYDYDTELAYSLNESTQAIHIVLREKINIIEKLEKTLSEKTEAFAELETKNSELVEKVKTEFLDLGENMLPKSYLRISKRFPHLNLQEIIDFEKKVRENGGSIQVHAGEFVLTDRHYNEPIRHASGNYYTGEMHQAYISWNCCLHKKTTRSTTAVYGAIGGYFERGASNSVTDQKIKKGIMANLASSGKPVYKLEIPFCDNELTNRDPCSKCFISETFYLKEEDERIQDIKQVTLQNVSSTISHNVNVLEETIKEYSNKILKLKQLQETLDLLVTI